MQKKPEKKRGTLHKVFMGMILGSAVAAVANPKSRDFLRKKGGNILEASKKFVQNHKKKEKSIWHTLHEVFHRKKDDK